MRTISTVVAGLVLVAGCGSQPPPPPQQIIDTTSIKAELLTIGKAEGQYLVAHSTYATLDQLQQDNLLTGGASRRGYIVSVDVNGSQGYTVTAAPSDPDKKNWPTLVMDQTSQIAERRGE
jgi:hypothetical protein